MLSGQGPLRQQLSQSRKHYIQPSHHGMMVVDESKRSYCDYPSLIKSEVRHCGEYLTLYFSSVLSGIDSYSYLSVNMDFCMGVDLRLCVHAYMYVCVCGCTCIHASKYMFSSN